MQSPFLGCSSDAAYHPAFLQAQVWKCELELCKTYNEISSDVHRIGSVICSMSGCRSQTGIKIYKDGDKSQQSKPAPIQFGNVFFTHSISLSISALSYPRVKLHAVDVCKFIVRHYQIMPVFSLDCLSLSSCPYYTSMQKVQAKTDVPGLDYCCHNKIIRNSDQQKSRLWTWAATYQI